MARVIDLDAAKAARAEAAGESASIRFAEKDWTLPAELPWAVAEAAAGGDGPAAMRAIELLLVGPGSAWFERQLAALPAEERGWIRDLGVLGESDKLAALRSCDLLVQPSPHEAFGIVFLEAWACGLPVIGADAGAIPGVVERGGLVFRPGDADDLARAVARLLDEPELARAAARRGLERVEEEFEWDRIAATVDALKVWDAAFAARGEQTR